MPAKWYSGVKLVQAGALIFSIVALPGVACITPPNNGGGGQTADVTFTPAATTFATSISVSLACDTAGATIRYTTDGTEPSATVGTEYSGTAILLTSTTTIKAIASASGMTDSAVTQATYTKLEQVATPTFVPNGGSFSGSVDVQIACATTGATIRYTTDGSTPSQSNGTVIANGGSVTLTGTTALAAIAYASGMTDSTVKQATYTQVAISTQVAQPRFSPDGGSFAGSVAVQVSCSTAGATIRYTTDGSTPSQSNGTVISSGSSVTLTSTTTLIAIAYASGMTDSPLKQATYTKLEQVAEPAFSPDGGLFDGSVNVQITCATVNATIRYTTDGSTPTDSNGAPIASGTSVTLTTTTTLKAIAYATGMVDSTVKQATFTRMDQVAEPTFSPDGGLFVMAGDVQISCATAGATIRYTTDGSTPSASNGTVIANGGSVHITATTTIKAIASASAMIDSPVKQATTLVMEFVLVSNGTFQMGDQVGTSVLHGSGANELPVHDVTITHSFYLGKYEVKQSEWEAIMGANPSYFKGDSSRPVELVSWDDCQAFAAALSTQSGMTLRLPTEAEWEYACKAGTTTDFSFGNDLAQLTNYGWYFDEISYTSHPVGQKLPNPWGLYDMHGNVWEWCSDWFGVFDSAPATDPTGPGSGVGHVVRGGSWHTYDLDARSSSRYPVDISQPEYPRASDNIGLRLVLEVP